MRYISLLYTSNAVAAALAAALLSIAPIQAGPLPALNCGNLVSVPANLQSAPFDQDRSLCVPEGFSIAVYARVPAARFLAVTPDGNLLVSQPSTGKVIRVHREADGNASISDFASGLYRPHDMVFHAVDGQMYLYLAEGNQVSRSPYNNGDGTIHDRQILVSGLPSASSSELQGAYAHELKNIAVDSNHRIYVSIASATNADPNERNASPMRGAIYIYEANGTGGRLYAAGLRNAEGVRFVPGTDQLWAAVNNRDNIAYPHDDGSGNYGKVWTDYVNNHPPEEFTAVRDGGDYGWPLANPNPDTAGGVDNMPFDPDQQNNPLGAVRSVDTFDRINKGIQAHSAPLGLTFLKGTAFAPEFADGVAIALHGSWNRTPPTGYKVIYFPWNTDTQTPGAQQDFVDGWLDNDTGKSWGRPVATAVDRDGSLFISDDQSGTVYRLTYQTQPASAVGRASALP